MREALAIRRARAAARRMVESTVADSLVHAVRGNASAAGACRRAHKIRKELSKKEMIAAKLL